MLSWSISSIFQQKFTLSVHRSLKQRKFHIKSIFWGFKVIQGHRCWYPQKARQQCKSVSICNRYRARLVDSSRNRTFSRGTQIWCTGTEDSLNLGGRNLHRYKKFNAENFIRWLSWSISSDFDAVHSWNMCGSLKSRKKFTKTPIFGFNVVQGHRCWYPRKARQQCLLWCAESLCLSATVLVLD